MSNMSRIVYCVAIVLMIGIGIASHFLLNDEPRYTDVDRRLMDNLITNVK